MRWFLIFQTVLLLLWGSKASALDHKNLRNFTTAAVIVEEIPKEAAHFGVNEDRIKTMVQLKLLKNGIAVCRDIDECDAPTFDIAVNSLIHDDMLFCTISITVREQVVPWLVLKQKRDPQTGSLQANRMELLKESEWAIVWKGDTFGVFGRARLPEEVYQMVNQTLDGFLRDFYLSRQKVPGTNKSVL
ncbi:MAG: hypothetical protein EKK48_28465 [Candidatus Melainabacteria bacterium]|nr:MAG: hypothetical protein EKK48_28465 [Candidatus Melainabacteria bacterium]